MEEEEESVDLEPSPFDFLDDFLSFGFLEDFLLVSSVSKFVPLRMSSKSEPMSMPPPRFEAPSPGPSDVMAFVEVAAVVVRRRRHGLEAPREK